MSSIQFIAVVVASLCGVAVGVYYIRHRYVDVQQNAALAELKAQKQAFDLRVREGAFDEEQARLKAQLRYETAEFDRKAAEEKRRKTAVEDTEEDAKRAERRRIEAGAAAYEANADQIVLDDAEACRFKGDLVELYSRYIDACGRNGRTSASISDFSHTLSAWSG